MFEVTFFKQFTVSRSPRIGGPIETTIFWGNKDECDLVAKRLNNQLTYCEISSELKRFGNSQESIPEDFQKMVNDNFMNLI